VAVVQISKIQIRRGKKNSDTGVPQLSSAELAWAVDTQELYIGNGSVEEGAPAVGNTKVITENDNILELASSYQFKSNDTSITLSTKRPLLDKIDEIEVSVLDFGAVGDGSTDNTTFFKNALDQLFKNVDPDFKKVLVVPNGTYLFVNNLSIPSDAIIRGETRDGAIFHMDTFGIDFETTTGLGIEDFNSSNRPKNIIFENVTMARSSGSLDLSGVANATFNNVKFKGEYVLGNAVSSYSTEPSAVVWNNNIEGIKVTDISFNNCIFESNSISVKCNQTIDTQTDVDFKDCKFDINDSSIYITGVSGQVNNWNVRDCKFNEVATQIFNSTNGTGTRIERCNFTNCGNGTGTAANPESSYINFGEFKNNLVLDCFSDRQQQAGVVSSESISSISEVSNADYVSLKDRNSSEIFLTDSFRPVAVFSALNQFISMNYTLRLSNHIRIGKLLITIGDDRAVVAFTDDYKYSDVSLTSPGGKIMTGFEFKVELKDNDTDSGIETVVVFYKNPLGTGATGNISFDIEYGV